MILVEAFERLLDVLWANDVITTQDKELIRDNLPHEGWTEESAIDYLRETGWLPEHDKILTERPRGEWIDVNGDGSIMKCSRCNEKVCCRDNNFCPNCGASMARTCGNCYWFSKVTVPCCEQDKEPTTENEKACDRWEEGEAEWNSLLNLRKK